MVSVLLNWMILGGAAVLFGSSLLCLIKKIFQCNISAIKSWDCIIISGIIFLTVYAQIFSLFYKVAGCAVLIMGGLGCIFAVFLLWKKRYKEILPKVNLCTEQWILLFICTFIVLIWTSLRPDHPDTTLYHSQAIRWIEEYGIVPGLGNFHNRLAYNSAFMALQALFSFRWLTGQSLHSVNGFLALLFMGYAVLSIKRDNVISASNLIKMIIILYGTVSCGWISSPCSDLPAMFLVLWINAKWMEAEEKREEHLLPYIFICIVSVFAVTIKLSAAICVLLILYPLVKLIKNKQFKIISCCAICCIVIVIPFIIRNVIISGYVLYPYAQIDLFNFDWEMPASVVEYDSMEITVWGRGNCDVNRYNEAIGMWFPEWFDALAFAYKILTIICLLSIILTVVYFGYSVLKKKINYEKLILLVTNVICIVFWLFSAPLIRYGWIYMMILPCVLLSILIRKNKGWSFLYKIRNVIMVVALFSCLFQENENMNIEILKQQDYENKETNAIEFENMMVYVSEEGDRAGYDPFPSLPYEGTLNVIELRGSEIKDGFRVKEEWRKSHIRNNGNEW